MTASSASSATRASQATRATARKPPARVLTGPEVRRVKAHQKATLLGQVKSMQHRRPERACPLCPLWGVRYDVDDPLSHGRQHVYAELLWREWDGRRDWPQRVAQVASELSGVEVSPEQARRHFTYHRVEQPAPSERLDRRRALADATMLSPQAQAILRTLYRTRLLSLQQVLELFFADYPKRSARTLAARELQVLAHGHFAYRLYPDPEWERWSGFPDGLAQEVFYLFGRNGGPYIEATSGARVWSDAYTTMARQVGRQTFVHDWRANNVYVALKRALRARGGRLTLPNGEESEAYAKEENWYGARLIGMRLWSRRLQRELDMRPDGFATLSLERSGYEEGSLPSSQLPFFYEFDNESKEAYVVAEQMLAYHHLALSGEAGKRFPDLAVKGYAVPMVMVFRGRGRVNEVGRSFRRRAKREGYRQGGAPIFLVAEAEWNADPFAEGILRLAWDEGDEPVALLPALLRSSARLLEARTLTAGQVLTLDPKPSPRRQAAKDASAREARKERRAEELAQAPKPALKTMKDLKAKATVTPPAAAKGAPGEKSAPAPKGTEAKEVAPARPTAPRASRPPSPRSPETDRRDLSELKVDPRKAAVEEPVERRRRPASRSAPRARG